ncbi:hypothetical protein [Bacillus cereus group sp. BfR-BA-01363]|uniref:hypothetical protein n=1 Tax=unclassified Bacillus cereus group TaxID=2750818 RepID=UPI001F57873C|nr:hypothetical protein [Bacillus cereus group sp. BfR-BA-01363]MDX5853404.1 hypothetical protein [Bacillus cereus group sp. BfR-BA-01363]
MLVDLKALKKRRNKMRIGKGMYLAKSGFEFNFHFLLEICGVQVIDEYEPIVDTDERYISRNGVCDNPQQILEYIPELETSKEKYVVALTRVRKVDQSPYGGWRWCKWGKYIGTQKATAEYLYDEEYIDEIYCYKIFKVK